MFHRTFCCTWQSQVPISTTPRQYGRTDGHYQTYYLPCFVGDNYNRRARTDRQTHKQTPKQINGRYQTYHLPCFAVHIIFHFLSGWPRFMPSSLRDSNNNTFKQLTNDKALFGPDVGNNITMNLGDLCNRVQGHGDVTDWDAVWWWGWDYGRWLRGCFQHKLRPQKSTFSLLLLYKALPGG